MSKTTGALQDFYADQWDSPQFNPVLRDASVPSAKMSGSFEKSIKGATKIKVSLPAGFSDFAQPPPQEEL